MKVSHIIYKVKDLDNAVKEWTEKGFCVEYGKTKNPYNAIIYFSEGPYIELLASTGMPRFLKKILKFAGQRNFIERLDDWDKAEEGWIGLCIESYHGDLNEEREFLNSKGIKSFSVKGRRMDTKGRDLRFTSLFPDELSLPFLMSYFNINPKPKEFVHPNGITNIETVEFTTNKEAIQIISELVDDTTLKLSESRKDSIVKEVCFKR